MIVTAVGVLSFLLYPLVNRLSKKYGKKKLMIVSFVFLIVSFIYISMMPYMTLVRAVKTKKRFTLAYVRF
ncbi:hypothetical protein [Cohnella herbarum]|uniref:hypothetical protein n=1 Tax=Cohnella herbarum TaxID=2728023 RepID=UPI0035C17A7C